MKNFMLVSYYLILLVSTKLIKICVLRPGRYNYMVLLIRIVLKKLNVKGYPSDEYPPTFQ